MSHRIAILHYSAAPVVGGVEAVIQAHARLLGQAGKQVTVIAGRGEAGAMPEGTKFKLIPEMDSMHPQVSRISTALEQGRVPDDFEGLAEHLRALLETFLASFDHVIAHNLFTKHFNLPLTTALCRLLDAKRLRNCIAWCHDITWTSPHSKSKVHPGFPWDALRTYRPDVTYVAVSRSRQGELAGLLDIPQEKVRMIYNGVEPSSLLGLSPEGEALIQRLSLWERDLVLLLPVRITQAKNIEFAFQVTAELKRDGLRPLLVVTGPPDQHDQSKMDYYRSLQELRQELKIEAEARFVYEAGPNPGEPCILDSRQVGELYRVSDLLFMPSHREGFGLPVLEAGLAGLPVICTPFPAAREIGAEEVLMFEKTDPPEKVAGLIQTWFEHSPVARFHRRVRQGYTWQAIVAHNLLPLLDGGATAA
jgi:glycosyltransferase involved in cell wall biosynthesis